MTREPYPSETADRFIVRLPEGMRERIREAAEANNRSMNSEIVARLEQSFSGPPLSVTPELEQMVTRVIQNILSGQQVKLPRDSED